VIPHIDNLTILITDYYNRECIIVSLLLQVQAANIEAFGAGWFCFDTGGPCVIIIRQKLPIVEVMNLP
jgi:hypothetical protein